MSGLARAVLVVALPLCLAVPVRAWGELGHRLVNAAAIENLPEPLRSYFRARQAYLVEHAIDPDLLGRENPDERPHHYTEADAYEPNAFLTFKKLFVEERRQPSATELQHGDAAWRIERFTLRLAEALRRRRWDEADRAAVFDAHYAADLTQPLHTVINYDGQLTGQNGIHARFETDLIRTCAGRWVFHPRLAVEEADLRARIFRELFTSYDYRNPLFAADRIAGEGRNYQDPEYWRQFERLAGLLARRRLEAAISFVSSLWYTAWVRAGKPDLRSAATEWRRDAPRLNACSGRPAVGAETDACAPLDLAGGGHADGAGGLSARAAALEFLVGGERQGRLCGFSPRQVAPG